MQSISAAFETYAFVRRAAGGYAPAFERLGFQDGNAGGRRDKSNQRLAINTSNVLISALVFRSYSQCIKEPIWMR